MMAKRDYGNVKTVNVQVKYDKCCKIEKERKSCIFWQEKHQQQQQQHCLNDASVLVSVLQ